MTIDEAIESLKYDIEIDMYIRDIAPQLAEWLEELKGYRDKNKMVVRVDVENMDSIKDKIEELSKYAESQYNKAIDDFVKALQEKIEKDLANPDLALECKKCGIWKNYDIKEIAEQLKAGVENEY